MKPTVPQLADELGISNERLRYQLLHDPNAPRPEIKRGKRHKEVRHYDYDETMDWWRKKMVSKPTKKIKNPPKPLPTAKQVSEWIAYQRLHKISFNKLAQHLGIYFDTLKRHVDKYEAGQLK